MASDDAGASSLSRDRQGRSWSRRQVLRIGAAAGVAAGGTAVAVLLRPPISPPQIIDERLRYVAFPTDQWWNALAGLPVRVTDFEEWSGALAVWRGLFTDAGVYTPGTGFLVIVVRVKRDPDRFEEPGDVSVPSGYSLFYDDPDRDIRIVVYFTRCTHLCCSASWHISGFPPLGRDYESYVASPADDIPTFYVYGQDPIYCVCHGAQWEPMVLVRGRHPSTGTSYVGARTVHGPAWGPLPVVAVRSRGDILEGGMIDPSWYAYCD